MSAIDGKRLAVVSAASVFSSLMGALVMYLLLVHPAYTDYKEQLGSRDAAPMTRVSLPQQWIISGSPAIRANSFGSSHDSSAISGVWECDGPAKFEWHYVTDEAIYILEGTAEIEYLGKKLLLTAGDRTQFAAGTKAIWTVPNRVKKAYLLHDPGRLVRMMRKLVNPAHVVLANEK